MHIDTVRELCQECTGDVVRLWLRMICHCKIMMLTRRGCPSALVSQKIMVKNPFDKNEESISAIIAFTHKDFQIYCNLVLMEIID